MTISEQKPRASVHEKCSEMICSWQAALVPTGISGLQKYAEEIDGSCTTLANAATREHE